MDEEDLTGGCALVGSSHVFRYRSGPKDASGSGLGPWTDCSYTKAALPFGMDRHSRRPPPAELSEAFSTAAAETIFERENHRFSASNIQRIRSPLPGPS